MDVLRILTCCLLVGVFQAPFLAAVTVHKPAFTIKLPDGWVEIPANILATMHDELQRRAPNAPIPAYDYGFQLKTQKWLGYPYLLVQVANTGRIAERQLRTLPRININKALDSTANDFAAVMKNALVGQMQYDEDANVVWMATQSDVVGVGRVQGISGLIPTEKGGLQFHGYSTVDTFFTYLPYFRQMIITVTPSPELAYKRTSDSPLASASGSWLETAGKILIGLIIAGIVAFVAGVGRKSKKTPA